MEKKHDKKRVFLSVQEKMDIAEESQRGVPTKILCRKYGVSTSVIYRAQRESTLLSSFGSRGGHTLQHKNRRTSPYVELERRLYSWIQDQQIKGKQLTDLLLRDKARKLSGEFGATSFVASGGWLRNFKNRHRIRLLPGENDISDDYRATLFVQKFRKRIQEEKLSLSNIYNMHEMGLLWKTVPLKTFNFGKEGKLTAFKKKKYNVSIGLCANTDGTHKLPPLFVHKFKSPPALKGCGRLPVVYKSEPQACINLQIFNEWYEQEFKPRVRHNHWLNGTGGKVLLLVDDSSNHKRIDVTPDFQFEIVYMPVNTTTLIRPMEQGIIERFKTIYMDKVSPRILKLEKGINEFYDTYNIKDCIYLLNETWNDITAANIKYGWNKCLSMYRGEEKNRVKTSKNSQRERTTLPITDEDCIEILWRLKEKNRRNMEIETDDEETDTDDDEEEEEEEEAEAEEEEKEEEEENKTSDEAGPSHEAGPSNEAGPSHEAGPSNEAGPSHEAGPSNEVGVSEEAELSFIERKRKFVSEMEDGLKKFAKNNKTLLIMGEALLRCLETEAPPDTEKP